MADIITPTAATPASKAIDAINQPSTAIRNSGLSELDQGDFLRLLTVQLQQQDPFEPLDNKEMLAQMAQFSQLAGSTRTNGFLEEISTKLDALIEAQQAAPQPAPAPAPEQNPTTIPTA